MIRAKGLMVLALCAGGLPARAGVVALEVHQREPFAGGKAFGDAGFYEKITGIVRFAVDPAHARNRVIVDLERAPRRTASGSRSRRTSAS